MLVKIVYWLAVVAISLALVAGLILWFESQDASEIEAGAELRSPAPTALASRWG